MPLPAVRCRPEQTIVKMEMAPDLSLRGRFAPVAISGRHCRFAQVVDKSVLTDCVCSGAHCAAVGGFAALRMRRPLYGERAPCEGPFNRARALVHRSTTLTWQSREGSCVFAGSALLSGRVLRDCTPRALPRASRSGRHVGLWPPRNDKLGGLAPLNCCCTTCNCLRRSGSAAAAEPSKYPGMHPRKCGKAVAVGGFTKRSKKTSVWVLTKLRLGGIVSLALRGTEC